METINNNYKNSEIDLQNFMIQFSSLNIQIYQDLTQRNLQLSK